jgi:phage-related protein
LDKENLMADIRTLKLALLADTKQFIDGLDKADKETRSFSDKLGGALKAGALAFAAVGAAAGAMAIKIGIEAVKAAIEDEKAMKSLAQTLKNTTKATDAQIAATEDFIDKTARATGVADDQLRPSLDRLVRSTQDITKAQKLQTLALDISAGTGKDLATVTEALGKAYDGNLGALKRIGVPLDENIIKSKDFDKAVVALSETFAGQADVAANTFAGRMARIKIALDEAKESLGQALLPILEKFARFATDTLAPALQGLVDGLIGKKKSVVPSLGMFKEATNEGEDAGYSLGVALRDLGSGLGSLAGAFDSNTTADSGFVRFINLLTRMVEGLDSLFAKLDAAVQRFRDFKQAFDDSLIGQFASATGQFAPEASFGDKAKGLVGINTNKPTVIINNNVKGAIDPQGTARTITKVQNTALKTTGIKPFNFGFR